MHFLSSPPERLMEITDGLNSHHGCLEDVNMLRAVKLCLLSAFYRCGTVVFQNGSKDTHKLPVLLTLLSTQLKGGRINDLPLVTGLFSPN